MKQRNVIFLSYSGADNHIKNEFEKHMRVALLGEGDLELFVDTNIEPGKPWNADIGEALDRTLVAVFLVSVDLLNSRYVLEVEIPRLILAARRGDVGIGVLFARPIPAGGGQVPIENEHGEREIISLTDYEPLVRENRADNALSSIRDPHTLERVLSSAARSVTLLAKHQRRTRSTLPARNHAASRTPTTHTERTAASWTNTAVSVALTLSLLGNAAQYIMRRHPAPPKTNARSVWTPDIDSIGEIARDQAARFRALNSALSKQWICEDIITIDRVDGNQEHGWSLNASSRLSGPQTPLWVPDIDSIGAIATNKAERRRALDVCLEQLSDENIGRLERVDTAEHHGWELYLW